MPTILCAGLAFYCTSYLLLVAKGEHCTNLSAQGSIRQPSPSWSVSAVEVKENLEISIWRLIWDGLAIHCVLWGTIFYKKKKHKSHHCKSWRKVGQLKREPCFRELFWDPTNKNKALEDCQENRTIWDWRKIPLSFSIHEKEVKKLSRTIM